MKRLRTLRQVVGIVLLLTTSSAFAWNANLGMIRFEEKVQDRAGKEASDPWSPTLSFGHSWQVWNEFRFDPRLGYIQHVAQSDDGFGPYKKESFVLQYDASYPIFSAASSGWIRFGFSHFMKTISGAGGTVTVPNGGGTATAYRPERVTSSTGAVGVGVDWLFPSSGDMISGYRASGQLFVFEALDSRRQLFALSLIGGFEF